MGRWRRKFRRMAGTGAAVTAAAATAGTLLWRRSTTDLVDRLLHPAEPDLPDTVSFDTLEVIPQPVARFLRFALQEGQPFARRGTLSQRGVVRSGASAPWHPFRASQVFTTSPRGFVRDARIHMAPLVNVRVRDSYVRGRAAMLGRVASVVPVVSRGDTPELASATLHRWLAEAPWYPTALLPSEGVTWSAIDEDSARATITDGGITVSLDFSFGDDGRIERAYTPARYRDVDGAGMPTPWACHYRHYESVAGVRVPMAASASWMLPDGELTYWRCRVIDLSYDS
jgi:Family of unknown function (DUF6544)